MIPIRISHGLTRSGVKPKQVDFSRPSTSSLTVPSPPMTTNLQNTAHTTPKSTAVPIIPLLPIIAVKINLLDNFRHMTRFLRNCNKHHQTQGHKNINWRTNRPVVSQRMSQIFKTDTTSCWNIRTACFFPAAGLINTFSILGLEDVPATQHSLSNTS